MSNGQSDKRTVSELDQEKFQHAMAKGEAFPTKVGGYPRKTKKGAKMAPKKVKPKSSGKS